MTDPLHPAQPTIEVVAVSKWFGQKVAVSDVDVSFGPGLTGLLGPNGAGKTTMLRMLTGMLKPSEGEVRILGENPRAHPRIYEQVGFVPEDEAVWDHLSARRFIEVSAQLSGMADTARAADQALDEVQLQPAADRKLATFSKGMRQRAKVAAALVHQPQILLLDEPLNGTDPVQRARLISLFREMAASGRTVIVSSHVLAEVDRMADRVVAMVDGRLAGVGDVAGLRAAMSDRPLRVRVDADNVRRLGTALLSIESIAGVEIADSTLHVLVEDAVAFGTALPELARQSDVRLITVQPEDESLESVFRYLVGSAR